MPPPAGSNAPPPTVIVRRVKKVAAAHHGGAWKVAYADFVTAMMAFFLLLWLLNATTEEQRRAISNYFAPASASQTTSGAGGMLGGRTFSDGAMPERGGTPSVILAAPPPEFGEEEVEEETEGRPEADEVDAEGRRIPRVQTDGRELDMSDPRDLAKAAAIEERRQFEEAAAALRQAIAETPDLERLAASLVIDQTAEGLRIQIVDQEKIEMFPLGSSQMYPYTRELLQKVVTAVSGLPHKLSVGGYTDATPYASDRGYSNWELSSDRANASRRALVELGLTPERITRVVGRADTDLLVPDQPTSPRNRRISITLLRRTPLPAGGIP